jgi:hypothetical protein
MNREHFKSGIALVCAAIPIVAALVLWVAPELPVRETLATQVSAVLQSALVLLGFRFVRKTSLPEGLALGYFWSFVEPLATSIPNKHRVEIGGTSYAPTQVRIEILLPAVSDDDDAEPFGLKDLRARIGALPEAALDTGEHGMRTVRVRKSSGPHGPEVTIVDVPRTLDVLERTLAREIGAGEDARLRKIGGRELAEFSARLERSLKEQRGAYFQSSVAVTRSVVAATTAGH